MSFESWEDSLYNLYYGHDEYEPDEDCPCGCEGDYEECTYDPDEEAAIAEAEYKLNCMDLP